MKWHNTKETRKDYEYIVWLAVPAALLPTTRTFLIFENDIILRPYVACVSPSTPACCELTLTSRAFVVKDNRVVIELNCFRTNCRAAWMSLSTFRCLCCFGLIKRVRTRDLSLHLITRRQRISMWNGRLCFFISNQLVRCFHDILARALGMHTLWGLRLIKKYFRDIFS